MKKHFVTFYSTETFRSEQSTFEIESWDVEKAIEKSKTLKEKYGAVPYGFMFFTRERTEDMLDSKVTKSSNMYYLGGEVLTLEEVKAKNDPDDEILIKNMEFNDIKKVIINTNSFRFRGEFKEGDVLLG